MGEKLSSLGEGPRIRGGQTCAAKRRAGEVWTVLTNMAVSLARLLRNGERTLREVREKCCADPSETANRLGFNS